MGSEWKTVNLSSCASFQEGYVNPTQKKPEYFDGDIKWLRATDLNGSFVYSTSRTLSEAGYKSAGKSAYLFEPDTLAISKSGTIGRLGILKDYMCGNRAVINIKPDKAKVDPLFIFYVLSSRRHEIENLAIGSVQPNLYTSALGTIQFKKPKLEEQKNISYILASIDNKIQLNRETNKTLEQMAQALFKSWFVDFDPVIDNALAAGKPIPEELQARAQRRQQQLAKPDHQPLPDDVRQLFPSEFEETEALGWVPKGWEVKQLAELATLTTKSLSPAKEGDKSWSHYSLPAFDNGKIPAQDKGHEIKSGKYWIPKSAVLVSKLNPHTPRVWLPDITEVSVSICSTEFMPFVPVREEWREFLYALMCSDFMNIELSNRVSGTTGSHQRVRPKEVALLPILMPTNDVITELSSRLKIFYGKEQHGINNNLNLEKLRDTLLPKLISGELRLPESMLESETKPSVAESAYE
ncbi:MAG: type I restriction enzyme S subunit [Marinomonas primoryensis]|jgi:type I restriction enzyme S subunit